MILYGDGFTDTLSMSSTGWKPVLWKKQRWNTEQKLQQPMRARGSGSVTTGMLLSLTFISSCKMYKLCWVHLLRCAFFDFGFKTWKQHPEAVQYKLWTRCNDHLVATVAAAALWKLRVRVSSFKSAMKTCCLNLDQLHLKLDTKCNY